MAEKPKAVNFRVIELFEGQETPEPYKLLQEVRDKYHHDLKDANIALAWRIRNKEDKDGHIVLGKCVKVSDLHKEFAQYDFIIVLNKEVWDDLRFTREKKIALLDHECSHAMPVTDDDTGEHKLDELNRYLFRLRKHDIEEFQSVVAHHGVWKRDLELFANTLIEKKKHPLFEEIDPFPKQETEIVLEPEPMDPFTEPNPEAAKEAVKPEHDAAFGLEINKPSRHPRGFSGPTNHSSIPDDF